MMESAEPPDPSASSYALTASTALPPTALSTADQLSSSFLANPVVLPTSTIVSVSSHQKTKASCKLFVSNLPEGCTESDLRLLFSKAAFVRDVDVVRERDYGFVSFDNVDQATIALNLMRDHPFRGKLLRVAFAKSTVRGPGATTAETSGILGPRPATGVFPCGTSGVSSDVAIGVASRTGAHVVPRPVAVVSPATIVPRLPPAERTNGPPRPGLKPLPPGALRYPPPRGLRPYFIRHPFYLHHPLRGHPPPSLFRPPYHPARLHHPLHLRHPVLAPRGAPPSTFQSIAATPETNSLQDGGFENEVAEPVPSVESRKVNEAKNKPDGDPPSEVDRGFGEMTTRQLKSTVSPTTKQQEEVVKVFCVSCKRNGHWAAFCPNENERNDQVAVPRRDPAEDRRREKRGHAYGAQESSDDRLNQHPNRSETQRNFRREINSVLSAAKHEAASKSFYRRRSLSPTSSKNSNQFFSPLDQILSTSSRARDFRPLPESQLEHSKSEVHHHHRPPVDQQIDKQSMQSLYVDRNSTELLNEGREIDTRRSVNSKQFESNFTGVANTRGHDRSLGRSREPTNRRQPEQGIARKTEEYFEQRSTEYSDRRRIELDDNRPIEHGYRHLIEYSEKRSFEHDERRPIKHNHRPIDNVDHRLIEHGDCPYIKFDDREPIEHADKHPLNYSVRRPMGHDDCQPIKHNNHRPIKHDRQSIEHDHQRSIEHVKRRPIDHRDRRITMDHGGWQPIKYADRGPVEHADRGPVEHADRGPVEHADRGPVEHADRGPVEHAVRQPVEHAVRKPVEHAVRKPVEHAVRQPVEHFDLRFIHNSDQRQSKHANRQAIEHSDWRPIEHVEPRKIRYAEQPSVKKALEEWPIDHTRIPVELHFRFEEKHIDKQSIIIQNANQLKEKNERSGQPRVNRRPAQQQQRHIDSPVKYHPDKNLDQPRLSNRTTYTKPLRNDGCPESRTRVTSQSAGAKHDEPFLRFSPPPSYGRERSSPRVAGSTLPRSRSRSPLSRNDYPVHRSESPSRAVAQRGGSPPPGPPIHDGEYRPPPDRLTRYTSPPRASFRRESPQRHHPPRRQRLSLSPPTQRRRRHSPPTKDRLHPSMPEDPATAARRAQLPAGYWASAPQTEKVTPAPYKEFRSPPRSRADAGSSMIAWDETRGANVDYAPKIDANPPAKSNARSTLDLDYDRDPYAWADPFSQE